MVNKKSQKRGPNGGAPQILSLESFRCMTWEPIFADTSGRTRGRMYRTYDMNVGAFGSLDVKCATCDMDVRYRVFHVGKKE